MSMILKHTHILVAVQVWIHGIISSAVQAEPKLYKTEHNYSAMGSPRSDTPYLSQTDQEK